MYTPHGCRILWFRRASAKVQYCSSSILDDFLKKCWTKEYLQNPLVWSFDWSGCYFKEISKVYTICMNIYLRFQVRNLQVDSLSGQHRGNMFDNAIYDMNVPSTVWKITFGEKHCQGTLSTTHLFRLNRLLIFPCCIVVLKARMSFKLWCWMTSFVT